MRKTALLCLVLFIFCALHVTFAQTIPKLNYYEAALQFSDTSNANGTWAYGYSKRVGGNFIPYRLSGTSDAGRGWYANTLGETPLLVSQPNTNPDLLSLHPGPNNEPSVLRWTAPYTGLFNFMGSFLGQDPDYSSDVYVLKNKVIVYREVATIWDEKHFTLAYSLRKGDTIDLAVATTPGSPRGGAYAMLRFVIAPQLYQFSPVQFPGFPNTAAFSINNLGDVVGRYRDANNVRHGFVRRRGVYSTLDYPGEAHTYPVAINDLGEVLGYTWNADFTVSSWFLYSRGAFNELVYPGVASVTFAGINDFGNTTGFYDPGDYTSVGFVGKRDGSYFSFEMPGSCQGCTFPGAINSVGQIAGQYYDEYYNLHGFIRNPNGEFKTLDFPNASNGSGVYSINNWGAITGVYCGLNEWGDCQNFVAIGSQFVPVWSIEADQAGTSLTLNSINDAGQVVAYYLDATNSYHSFVGTPVLPLHSTVH